MFKQAYVRGVQGALLQNGNIAFPDAESAVKVADHIASRLNFEPQDQEVPREVTAKVAGALIEASNWFKGQPGFKAASFTQLESMDDLSKLAHIHVIDLMEKAAEGSTIEGGDKGNTEPSSGEAKMDASDRPEGYAANSLAKTEIDTKPGAVGSEKDQPAGPSNSPAGTNSVTEARTASLSDLLKKVAEGSTIMGGDKGNTSNSSGEAKMDAAMRPEGYARLPGQGDLGAMMALVGDKAVVGKEMTHPNAPAESPSGTNSVIQHSAKAAAEDPYIALFKKTATEIHQYLPGSLHEEAKVAHVRACMGMTTEEKAHYLHGLQKESVDKTAQDNSPQRHQHYDGRAANQREKAAEMPDFIREKIEAKKNEGSDDKKDDGDKKENPFAAKSDDKKDDDKKDDDKKEASLADYFRRISAAVKA